MNPETPNLGERGREEVEHCVQGVPLPRGALQGFAVPHLRWQMGQVPALQVLTAGN